MRGVELAVQKDGLDELLQGEDYGRERDALRRQGMPGFSRRTKRWLWLFGLVPVVAGLILALVAWMSGWEVFEHPAADVVFVFLSGLSAVVMVEVMLIDWVNRVTEDDEAAARTWLIRHAGQLRTGALLAPVPKSPAEELEAQGSVIEVAPQLLKDLIRLFRRAPLGVAVDPSQFTTCLWDVVRAWAKHEGVSSRRVRVLAECRLSEGRLRELAEEGHSDARKVLRVVADLEAQEHEYLEEARAAEARFEDLLRESRERLRDDRLAEISSKVAD